MVVRELERLLVHNIFGLIFRFHENNVMTLLLYNLSESLAFDFSRAAVHFMVNVLSSSKWTNKIIERKSHFERRICF